MASLYKCPNICNCEKADQGEIISIATSAPSKCPECGSNLILAKRMKSQGNNAAILGSIVLILLLMGAVTWFFFNKDGHKNTPPSNASSVLSTPSPLLQTATTLLRFHGSNTIGGKLLPELATAYLQQEGYTKVHKEDGAKEDESFIIGEHNGHNEQIEIQAHGSSTAFNDLKDGLCDIGMSSRKIKPEEQQNLLPILGDLTSNANEHVLALDGIALIVNPSNPIKTLSVAQVADIFSGTITDWSQLGSRAGTIAIYARDGKSGTYDFFNDAVLKPHSKTLAASAKRFENSEKLSDAVTEDPTGIGFIGLNYIGSNKVIAISDTGVEARKPSLLTIKTEDYLLSRRLYLYTAEKSSNPDVYKFIEFAVGSAAQPVVASIGLVNLEVTPVASDPNDARNQSAQWRSLTKGATEIATRFRFRVRSDDLDARANRDIGRIVYLLSHPPYQGKEVAVIGFSDAGGSPYFNLELSQSRANIVKEALEQEGVSVWKAKGLGAEAFVAPNDTAEHKEKNRRAEVWVK
jgi:phosphate transport system substrate-binding protein